MNDEDPCGVMSPAADLAMRLAVEIDGHHDSDTVSMLHAALDSALPAWLKDYELLCPALNAEATS